MSLSRKVQVGSVPVGGDAPVSIQTMWDRQVDRVDQDLVSAVNNLHAKGCDIIRFALPNIRAVDTLAPLLNSTPMPLVGDIHFDYKIALKAIEAGFHKIRINPGNIGESWKVEEIITAAAHKGTVIRIGANEGSLADSDHSSPESRSTALIEAAERNLELFEKKGFKDIVVSLKSSDIEVTYLSNKEFRKRHDYPLHLGITEAGPLIPAIVKSTIGLSDLLREGIGETIRISISDSPEYEVLTAKELLFNLKLRSGGIRIIGCPKCGRTQFDTHGFLESVREELNTLPVDLTVAVMGCSVNGPGEAKHADLGITGNGKQVLLFRRGEIIRREDICSAKEAFLEELDQLRREFSS